MGSRNLLMIQNNIDIPEDMSELTKNLEESGHLVPGTPKKGQSPAKFGYFGDKETEEENKRLKEGLAQKERIIGKLETEVKALKEQMEDGEIEK